MDNLLEPTKFETRQDANRFATFNRCACRGTLASCKDGDVYILRCAECDELSTAFNTQAARELQEQEGNEACTRMVVKAATQPKRSNAEILSELGL